jgi:hypothetical protein
MGLPKSHAKLELGADSTDPSRDGMAPLNECERLSESVSTTVVAEKQEDGLLHQFFVREPEIEFQVTNSAEHFIGERSANQVLHVRPAFPLRQDV